MDLSACLSVTSRHPCPRKVFIDPVFPIQRSQPMPNLQVWQLLTTLPYTELRSIMSLESVAKNLRIDFYSRFTIRQIS